jgi:ammonia channel protein AmtB
MDAHVHDAGSADDARAGVLLSRPRRLEERPEHQATAVLAAIVYSGTMSFVLFKLMGLVIPLRADANNEITK